MRIARTSKKLQFMFGSACASRGRGAMGHKRYDVRAGKPSPAVCLQLDQISYDQIITIYDNFTQLLAEEN